MHSDSGRSVIESRRLDVALIVLAAVLSFVVTLAFGYVLDDTTVIRGNPLLNGWSGIWRVWTQPFGAQTAGAGLYRPFVMSVFAFVWNAGGHWPLWFHLLVLAMHAAASVLVWRVLARALPRGPALIAALWFAVHPVHVEAVANIANSSEVLVALLSCALTLHLTRAARTPGDVDWGSAALAGVIYAAAFLTKESGAFAPVLAGLVLWGWPGDGAWRPVRRWWRVVVAFGGAALAVITLRLAVLGTAVTHAGIAATGVEGVDDVGRVKLLARLLPRIVSLLLWPGEPNPHYGPTMVSRSSDGAMATVAILLLVGVAIAAWQARRGEKRVLAAMGWAVVAFLPASNLLVPTGQILAERTLYVPSIGVAMLLGLAVDRVSGRLPRGSPWRAVRVGALAAFATVLALFLARSSEGAGRWRSNATVFAQMIRADSAGYRGYWLSGLEARYQGRQREALSLMGRAYELYPRERALLVDYSSTLAEAGDVARAASVAEGLMQFPELRADSAAVTHYLALVVRARGVDSARVAAVRIMEAGPSAPAAEFLRRVGEPR